MSNKIEKRKFLGSDVRVVDGEYIVLRDMFSVLGRVRSDGQLEGKDTSKLSEFLADLNKESDLKSFHITSKGKKQSREVQEYKCLKLDTVPIVLTQFKPTARKGLQALHDWIEFMKFVDVLLCELEVHKYIVTDKEKQLTHQEIICELGGRAVIENRMVNRLMAELIGVSGEVTKDDIRHYQDQTTIDLLEVREYLMTTFEHCFEVLESHREAYERTKILALRKYGNVMAA